MSDEKNIEKTLDDKAKGFEFNMRLEEFLSVCFLVPIDGDPADKDCTWGLPVMLHGSPGIGKTKRIHQAANAVNLMCKPVELGGRQPEDASGAPFLTRDDRLVIACILGAINELNAKGSGVLFLDELTCARPATQGAFLSCVQERRVGDVQFSKKIRVVCAGNPPNESAGGYTLQPPMANRMAHRDVFPPDVDDWMTYLIQGAGQDLEQIQNGEDRIVKGWPEQWPRVKGLLGGYLKRFTKSHLYSMPKQGHPNRGKAFATPRMLEAAGRAVATAMILGKDSSVQAELFAACVGAGHAVDWETWISEADLPDPVQVLHHGWKPDKTRLDRTVAVYTSTTAYVLSRPKKEDRLELAPYAWKRLADLLDAEIPDIALSPARSLIRAGFGTKASKEIADAARPIMLRFGKKGLQEFVEG